MSTIAEAGTVVQGDGTSQFTMKRQHIGRDFLALARGFWSGPTKGRAWLLTIGVLFFALCGVGISLAVNRWNGYFFNSLEQKNGAAVLNAVWIILGIAVVGIIVQVSLVLTRMRLQVRWRQWLTGYLTGKWLSNRRFYQLTITDTDASNPEFRMSDDARLAIDPLVEFAVGLLNAFLAAFAFLGVLFYVGGSITVGGVTIPAYMAIAVLVYATLTSGLMLAIGRPLVHRTADKNEGEAQFRYELTRVKESAESIALLGGDEDERKRLADTFEDLRKRWTRLIRQQAKMTWVSHGNFMLAGVVPLLLGAPKYLAGEITLGDLMQLQSAFVAVQWALNWLTDNAIRLAEWYASAMRVLELTDGFDELDRTVGRGGADQTITIGDSPDENIHIRNLSIAQRRGDLVIDDAELVINKGEKVLIRGESGTGKSTLIRALAGLWPWGSGDILHPKNVTMAFMPQKPYIPLGTLRSALLYPDSERQVDDEAIAVALRRVGLYHLMPRLDEEGTNFEQVLSGGEKQRLAFARLLLAPPDIVIMDEATSALDELSQANVMSFLREELAPATVITVGHRPGLEEYHDREIYLARSEQGPAVPHSVRKHSRLIGWLTGRR
jgi:putative ATP-binding cassette transporter